MNKNNIEDWTEEEITASERAGLVDAVTFTADGTIVLVFTMMEHMIVLNMEPGQEYLVLEDAADPVTQYVDTETLLLAEKTAWTQLQYLDTNYLGNTVIIDGIALGTRVIWPDAVETMENDQILSLDVVVGGEYKFIFLHPLYFTQEVFINVTA